jgi:hypothetical protein
MRFASVAFTLFAVACSSASSSPSDDPSSAAPPPPAAAGGTAPVAPPNAPPASSVTPSDAAKHAAETDPLCNAIGDFYWEIGDANGAIATGSVGKTYVQSTSLQIASATKLMFGAYIIEKNKADLAGIDLRQITMRSGRTNFDTCSPTSATVEACCAEKGASGGTNCDLVGSEFDHYNYGGGHFQRYAIDMGWAKWTKPQLAAELVTMLGADVPISFATTQVAAGIETTPAVYATFLRKILNGKLAIASHLGENAVCTLPGASCPTAHGSPVPEAWSYSYAHWVELDGTFSSPGLFGFYPWIDASKEHYGMVVRKASDHLTGPAAQTSYWHSVECGRQIRKAFLQ